MDYMIKENLSKGFWNFLFTAIVNGKDRNLFLLS